MSEKTRNEYGKAVLEELHRRVEALERTNARRDHVHEWRYSKTLLGSYPTWAWRCENDDVCGAPRSSTNSLAYVPAHFPAGLR